MWQRFGGWRPFLRNVVMFCQPTRRHFPKGNLKTYCSYLHLKELIQYSDGLRAGRPTFISWQNIYFFSMTFTPRLGPSQHSLELVPDALSPGVKWSGREADYSLPSLSSSKNGGVIPPLPMRLHGVIINYAHTKCYFYLSLFIIIAARKSKFLV
jgi:hypothetical protein